MHPCVNAFIATIVLGSIGPDKPPIQPVTFKFSIISIISKNPMRHHVTEFITVCEPFSSGSISGDGIRKRSLRFDELKQLELNEKTDFGIKWGASFLRPKHRHDELMLSTKKSIKRPKSFLKGSSYLNTGGADAFFIISNYTESNNGIKFTSKVNNGGEEHRYSGFMEHSMITPLIKNVTKGSKKLSIKEADCYCFTPREKFL